MASKFGGVPVEGRTSPVNQSLPYDPSVTNRGISPLQAARIGIGRGLMTIARGLGLADPEDPRVTQSFNQLSDENPVSTTIGEIAGESAPFLLPGAGLARFASPVGRFLSATALGATEGGLISAGKGGNNQEVTQAAGIGGTVAGALDLALPRISRLGSKIIRRALNRQPQSPILDVNGNPSPEFQEALNKLGLTLDDVAAETRRQIETGDIVDPQSVLRRDFLESQGIIPTRAQITGDATDFQKQQELFKTAGRVRSAIEDQDSHLYRGFENRITLTGGSANRSNSTAFDYIADRSIDGDAAVSAAYNEAKKLAGQAKVVKPTRLVKAMKGIAGSGQATGGLPSAVRDILKEKGVLTKGLKDIGRVDPKVAEEIRIDMNALYNSLTPFGRGKLRELKNALDDDVAEAVGDDVFKDARAMKAKFESDLKRTKVNKFDKRNKNLVRDILENKVNPDRFLDEAILSKSIRSADVEQLKRFLLLDGDGPGLDAWNDVRAEAMQRILDSSFNVVGGVPALSRAKINSALDRFGRDKLRVLFSKEERKFFENMKKVAEMREPVRGTALGRGPSAQAVGQLEQTVKNLSIVGAVMPDITDRVRNRLYLMNPSLERPLQPSQLSRAIPAVVAGTAAQPEDSE